MAVVECSVKLELITCEECGLLFAVPETFVDLVRELGNSIQCPNGHSNRWILPHEENRKQLIEKVKALELEKFKLLHELEQQEARVSPEVIPPETPAAPVPARVPAGEMVNVLSFWSMPDRRFTCPNCGKKYKSVACMMKHLRLEHKLVVV